MERPGGFKPLDLAVEPPEGEENLRCDLAQGAYNSAMRGKLMYFWLFFSLAVALVIAAGYALIAFDDDKTAAGWLALVAAVGAFLTTGVFGLLWKRASDDADKMWRRVARYCK